MAMIGSEGAQYVGGPGAAGDGSLAPVGRCVEGAQSSSGAAIVSRSCATELPLALVRSARLA
eukprot:5291637-Pyramimonas_sp.AAC.1